MSKKTLLLCFVPAVVCVSLVAAWSLTRKKTGPSHDAYHDPQTALVVIVRHDPALPDGLPHLTLSKGSIVLIVPTSEQTEDIKTAIVDFILDDARWR